MQIHKAYKKNSEKMKVMFIVIFLISAQASEGHLFIVSDFLYWYLVFRLYKKMRNYMSGKYLLFLSIPARIIAYVSSSSLPIAGGS